jgi:hypothetical protein
MKQKNDGLERHHIVPRSMGGKDNKDNLIVLTAREHFIAHRLLVKFTGGADKRKMLLAIHRMAYGDHRAGYRINARTYEQIRLYRIEANRVMFADPAWKKKQSETQSRLLKIRWQDPAFRARHKRARESSKKKGTHSEQYKQRLKTKWDGVRANRNEQWLNELRDLVRSKGLSVPCRLYSRRLNRIRAMTPIQRDHYIKRFKQQLDQSNQ